MASPFLIITRDKSRLYDHICSNLFTFFLFTITYSPNIFFGLTRNALLPNWSLWYNALYTTNSSRVSLCLAIQITSYSFYLKWRYFPSCILSNSKFKISNSKLISVFQLPVQQFDKLRNHAISCRSRKFSTISIKCIFRCIWPNIFISIISCYMSSIIKSRIIY